MRDAFINHHPARMDPRSTRRPRGAAAVRTGTSILAWTVAALLAPPDIATGAEVIRFTASPQGSWTNEGSWNDGAGPVPGADDTALFDHAEDEARTVTWLLLSPGVHIDRWMLRRGETRFRIFSANQSTPLITMLSEPSLAPGLLIADEPGAVASLVFEDAIASTSIRRFSAEHGALGWMAGSHGRLAIHRHAIHFSFGGRLDVGRGGLGEVEITNDSSIDAARLELGAAAGASGTVSLSGGGRIDVVETCHVGGLGHGAIVMDGVTHLACGDLVVGRTGSANGSLALDGTGASILVVDTADIGFLGAGAMTLRNGAGAYVGGFLSVGMAAPGMVTVDDPGSLAWIGGDVFLGTGPSPEIRVGNGGRLRVDGRLQRLTGAGTFTGRLAIHVPSPLTYAWEPAVRANGGSNAVPIHVTLDPLFTPVIGLTVELVHSAPDAAISTPALALPTLAPHLAWSVVQSPGRLAIRVVSAADFDGDGEVGYRDLLHLLGAFGACDRPDACPEDLTGDGVIDTADLLHLLAAWGAPGAG